MEEQNKETTTVEDNNADAVNAEAVKPETDGEQINDEGATVDVKEAEDVKADECECADSAGSCGKSKSDKKGSCRKDKKDKKEKKDKKDAKIEELNEKLVRLMAEYDNYRKRTDREKSAMFEMGAKAMVERIIPIIDNFERGFDCVSDDKKEDAFVQGMEKIYKQMIDSLAEAGVVAIEAVGKEFDPNIHNAVMHIDDEAYDNNVVVEEFQKGYMYKESLIRCSMVKVAN